jgi:NAD(P)-dependent dehydrogenase (short-subunit alcohol dehydrogenase family)
MNKLEGKTALITGGTSGIGLATAKAFVNEAAYTFITGRREAELAAAVKEIGRNVIGIQGDVSNLGDAAGPRSQPKTGAALANFEGLTQPPKTC